MFKTYVESKLDEKTKQLESKSKLDKQVTQMKFKGTLASGVRLKARKAWQRLAWPGLPGFLPGLPGKYSLEKCGKRGQGQAFVVTLATKAWLSWPSNKQCQGFLDLLAE